MCALTCSLIGVVGNSKDRAATPPGSQHTVPMSTLNPPSQYSMHMTVLVGPRWLPCCARASLSAGSSLRRLDWFVYCTCTEGTIRREQ